MAPSIAGVGFLDPGIVLGHGAIHSSCACIEMDAKKLTPTRAETLNHVSTPAGASQKSLSRARPGRYAQKVGRDSIGRSDTCTAADRVSGRHAQPGPYDDLARPTHGCARRTPPWHQRASWQHQSTSCKRQPNQLGPRCMTEPPQATTTEASHSRPPDTLAGRGPPWHKNEARDWARVNTV